MSSIQPLEYHIRITPDLTNFQFKGQVRIKLKADAAISRVDLNLLELAVWQCRLYHEGQWVTLVFSVDPPRETLSITLPGSVSGEFTVQIDYDGLINDQMAGFYRSRFTQEGCTRYIAVTQFQESSARQAFPCLDHPMHKAIFNLELIVPQGLAAIANTLPLSSEPLDDQRQQVVFAPSPRMSSYLVFFGVGAFEQVQDAEDPRVRVVHLPGLAHTTDLARDFGRKALHYCEQYYGIPYPLSKMDLIAIPDFAFGAMENWGAITFRENLLLHFADLTSRSGIQRICEVIAHEIAHQWFGNLVTPMDWKYLWLNESFATYFGYGAVSHYNPHWEVWQQFLHNETATALTRDGLNETFAIEIPGGEHVVINSSTAPIIYNKGASILRMIEGYIGSDNYRQGVRAYLQTHSYGCARSSDLWQAFENASAQPVTAMMQSWIGQPGHPVITARRDGAELILEQERFSYLTHDSDQTWIIPVTLTSWNRAGRATEQALILSSARARVELPADTLWYKINRHQTGFFRTRYADQENLAAIGQAVALRTLGVEDRWGVQNDLYALVRQNRFKLIDYLGFLKHYQNENDYLPLAGIGGNLLQAFLTAPAQLRADVAALGCAVAGGILARMGLTPAPDEPFTHSLLRDQLIWQAIVWNDGHVLAFADRQFHDLQAGRPVHADIARSVLQAAAWQQGQTALNWLRQRFDESPSEHERLNILTAMGAFREWAQTEQALAFVLEKVPPRNRYLPIAAAAANPAALPHLWTWYQKNLASLETFHPLLYERVITSVWPYAGLGREAEVIGFAEQYLPTHPHLADAVKLALENLMINRQMKERSC